jgi:phosphoribosylamine--glycine ligase
MKLPAKSNILLLGSGGREHAFAEKIVQSPHVARLFIAPGNAGTASAGTNADISPANFGAVKQFVLNNNVNMVIVGPEDPLVKGIYDFFVSDPEIRHIPVIGPSTEGARLEGSKDFAKAFMCRHGIPTAGYMTVTKDNIPDGEAFLGSLAAPYVLKADGLAAGKGVLIIESLDEAIAELKAMLNGKFGEASRSVVIEEHLKGIECSVFVATDGKNYKILPTAKDYKRVGEGDTGLNTGGMGAVSPVPFADEEFMERIEKSIIAPTVRGLAKDKIVYKGFIFIGLMNLGDESKVIEYNVRMGDPEAEVVLPRIKSDIVEMFHAMAHGRLDKYELEVDPRYAATVVCVSGGYPGDFAKGFPISGLQEKGRSTIYHAGTAMKAGKISTSGGRVLAVTSMDDKMEAALGKSYETISGICYEGIYFRRDIGWDILNAE